MERENRKRIEREQKENRKRKRAYPCLSFIMTNIFTLKE